MLSMMRDAATMIQDRIAYGIFVIGRLVFFYWLAAFVWLAVSWAHFGGAPIEFTYSAGRTGMAGETGWLAAWVAMWLAVFFLGLLAYFVARPPKASTGLFLCARYGLWVSIVLGGVFGYWLYLGPPGAANFLPLPLALGLVVATTGIAFRLVGPGSTTRTAARPGAGDEYGVPESGARVSRPTLRFDGIYGNDAIKLRLKEASQAITARRKDGTTQRNGILLFGGPGNGKTAFAEALAGELGLPLLTLTYADVASQWVGEKSARVRQAFAQAVQQQPCVLFIDEVDSFLESRDGQGDGVKEDRDLVNALLTLMVDVRRSRVILIAATNHMDRLDSAGVREGRFDFKVEITPPDLEARLGLLRKGLKDKLPHLQVEDRVVKSVAERWNGFSVKRILAVTEELPAYLKAQGRVQPAFDDFMGALRQLQGQRGHVPENVKPLSELVFSARTRDALDLVVGRMADPEFTEQHGGTLPTGVLFAGPPGTGKTAAAKALAKEIGWAFLPATGADLARAPKRLETLYAKAMDLRPTLIFVDEADELLRDRAYSNVTEATNKLLTMMDGVGDRVRDVVWVAATNNPEQIDPALLRGGRFAEKVLFELPSMQDLATYIGVWLGEKGIVLEAGLTPAGVADIVGDSSIASAEAVLQSSLNRAIARRLTPIIVHAADVERAVELVHGVQA